MTVLTVCGAVQIGRVFFYATEPVSVDFGEMMVAGAARRLADGAGLCGIYAPPGAPYAMPGVAYPPLFLALAALLVKAGLGALVAARLLAYTGYAAAGGLLGLLVAHESRSRRAGLLAAALPFCFWTLIHWLPGARVDGLGIAFALAAVLAYRRNAPLLLVVACCLAALFTKQTLLAAPAAIALDLWLRGQRRRAATFVAALALAGCAIFGGVNTLSGGTFASIFEPARAGRFIPPATLGQFWLVFVLDHLPLLLLGGVALVWRWRQGDRFWPLYISLTLALTAATLTKDGATDYYFNELAYIVAAQVAWYIGLRLTPRNTDAAQRLVIPNGLPRRIPFNPKRTTPDTTLFTDFFPRHAVQIVLTLQAVLAAIMVVIGDPAMTYTHARPAYNTALATVRDIQARHTPALILADDLLLATGDTAPMADYFIYGIVAQQGKRDSKPMVADVMAHRYAVIVIERGGFGRYPDAVQTALDTAYSRHDLTGDDGTLYFSIYTLPA